MLLITVTTKGGRQQVEHWSGPIDFGRDPEQKGMDPAQKGDVARVVIKDDLRVSRDHLRVEELTNGQARIQNLSARNAIRVADNSVIRPGEATEQELPLRLTVGETQIEINKPDDGQDPISKDTLETVALPVHGKNLMTQSAESLLKLTGTPSSEKLAHWFETVIAVQRAAAGSPEFYAQTARAMVDLVGLDRGLVLLRQGANWGVAAQAGRDEGYGRPFSNTILNEVIKEGRTFYQSKPTAASTTMSLDGIQAVVASPVFDASDQVVGALYGARTRFSGKDLAGIGPLEAQVVQLLAAAVGAGLSRLAQESQASQIRVQFEQFFTSDLAQELQRNPRLLEGQEREITVLFSDIRAFSRLSQRLAPTDVCRLVSAVMERLTVRVKEHQGVVVDYIGDGLMAMWNAPTNQKNHAALACRAALAMLEEMPALSSAWQSQISFPLSIGIGINTGPALVGNIGCSLKFKYGTLGHHVNLASRVEGATKFFKVPILITGSTHAQLQGTFATRRLCKTRVVGIDQPVDLYELNAEKATPEWEGRRNTYETALQLFENKQWAASCQAIYPMLAVQGQQYDVPALDLLSRSVGCLKAPPEHFDPVVEIPNK